MSTRQRLPMDGLILGSLTPDVETAISLPSGDQAGL
jgi:hypothetical protein